MNGMKNIFVFVLMSLSLMVSAKVPKDLLMIDAVERGNITKVKQLLKAGVSPDIQEEVGGHSLLQMAITQRFAGNDMDAKNASTKPPVNAVQIVKELLKAGANPNIQSKAGNTPLIYAVKYGCIYTAKHGLDYGKEAADIVKLLLEKGACIDIKNKKDKIATTYLEDLTKVVKDIDSLLHTCN